MPKIANLAERNIAALIINKRRKDGYSNAQIAEHYGISYNNVTFTLNKTLNYDGKPVASNEAIFTILTKEGIK